MTTIASISADTAGDVDSTQVSKVIAEAKVKKAAPPETAQQIWRRRLIIGSFWTIVLVLGLPIWQRTTAVYRAGLPIQSMTDWAEGKMCSPVFPLRIGVDANSISAADAESLIKTTQYALDDSNDFSAHHLRLFDLSNPGDYKEETALIVRLLPSPQSPAPSALLSPHTRYLDVVYPPTTSTGLAPFLASKLQETFAEEQALLARLISSNAFAAASKRLSGEVLSDIEKRTTRSMKYASTYHLTFSLLTSSAYPSSWAVEEAAEKTVAPLLRALSHISNFTVDTQVLPFATLPPSIQPQYSEVDKAWMLRAEDLGGFINAAEWPLSPSIGAGPTINFVLYVAPQAQTPLRVAGSSTNSWIVPQWGAVTIFNPSSKDTHTLSAADLESPLLNFASGLLSLLGVPASPSSSLSLRLSTLTRLRAASLLLSASSTLGSLARVVATLPSIPIPKTVAASVDSTITHLNSACSALRAGNFQEALHHGRLADAQAEKAFFERSMVGQVYFPDEHKVAVYLPLLGPMSVPLVMSALKEVAPYLRKIRRR